MVVQAAHGLLQDVQAWVRMADMAAAVQLFGVISTAVAVADIPVVVVEVTTLRSTAAVVAALIILEQARQTLLVFSQEMERWRLLTLSELLLRPEALQVLLLFAKVTAQRILFLQ